MTGQIAPAYKSLIPVALKGTQRPSRENIVSPITDATWGMTDEDPFYVLFFVSAGSIFLVVRRFDRKRPHTNQGTNSKPG